MCSPLDSEPEFSAFSFPLETEFYAVANQGIGLYSQNFYQNQRVRRSSIYIEPVLTSSEECNAFEDLLFFSIYFCLSRDLFQPACSLAQLKFVFVFLALKCLKIQTFRDYCPFISGRCRYTERASFYSNVATFEARAGRVRSNKIEVNVYAARL